MSTMLEELKIKVYSPYSADNFVQAKPDLVVVANALSRGNVELEALLRSGVRYTSFPSLTGELFLEKRTSVVVTGTHGKTTTTSLLAHVINELGGDPGFIIGGIPHNFPRSFNLGKGSCFVIEGDEYDTAFFDKGPKFLHYRPNHLIINNIEYDHADIYPNIEAIEDQFLRVASLVPETGVVFLNVDDPGVKKIMSRFQTKAKIIKVSTLGKTKEADVGLESFSAKEISRGEQLWSGSYWTKTFGNVSIETKLSGAHNLANIAQVIACVESLHQKGILKVRNAAAIGDALRSFKSVARRLDHLGTANDIDVFEDFAHHPTAVGLVIEGFRAVYPNRRLLVAFEPKNATSRRNIFQKDYVKKLGLADRVYLGALPDDKRIAETDRMDTHELAQEIGDKALAFGTNDDLLARLSRDAKPGDAVIFMSSGSFSGIQHKLLKNLS
jgi:UDP-N-acetylmuramate: L-alanyl-gamma-D-glutamyl-meso-diaminopimelate ligase